MSRIGKLPVPVPAGVDVTIDGSDIAVTGPKGTLRHTVAAPLTVTREEDGTLVIRRPDEERDTRSLHGLTRSLIANLVTGVTQGFEKKLEIVGTGYRAIAKGADVELSVGYSHPVLVEAPEGITLTLESPTKLTIAGIDKQRVGEAAATIRKIRRPEPYKGKGVRYAGEQVRRKAGKAGK